MALAFAAILSADDHIHAPNEKFNLKQFFGGILTMTALYDALATIAV